MNKRKAQLAAADHRRQMDPKTATTLRQALAYAQSIVDTVREPLLILDGALHIQTASRSFYSTFGVSPEETEAHFICDLGNGQWNIPALRILLEEVTSKGKSFRDFEVTHDFPSLGRRAMLINTRKLWTEQNDSFSGPDGVRGRHRTQPNPRGTGSLE